MDSSFLAARLSAPRYSRAEETDMLERINRCRAGESYFESDHNPFREASIRRSRIREDLRRENEYLLAQAGFIEDEFDEVRDIISEVDIKTMPDVMKIAILLDPRIRYLHQTQRIYGWGIDPDRVLEFENCYDVFGDDETDLLYCIDSPYTDEEIETVEDARNYVADLLYDRLGIEGALDPTSPGGLSPIYDEII